MSSCPLITVIVPVYNVETWLNRCINSICEQTYDNLQIVLVDDGSSDGSGSICDRFAANDSRIVVIHQDNGGLSVARNTGIQFMQGEYVCFVDSDDWLEKYFVEYLFRAISQTHADIAGCEYRKCVENKTYPTSDLKLEKREYSRLAAMSALIDNEIQQVVWNKLYKSELVISIPFEKGMYHEDEFWSYQIVAQINKYVAVSYVGYNYFQRANSIMGEKYTLRRLDAVEAKSHRQDFLEKNMQVLAMKGRLNLLFTCLFHGQLVSIHLEKKQKQDALQYLNTIIKRYPIEIIGNKNITAKQKFWIASANLSFDLTCKLRNILKIGY